MYIGCTHVYFPFSFGPTVSVVSSCAFACVRVRSAPPGRLQQLGVPERVFALESAVLQQFVPVSVFLGAFSCPEAFYFS